MKLPVRRRTRHKGAPGITVVSSDVIASSSWDELSVRSVKIASALCAAGIAPQDRVAIVARTSLDVVELVAGCRRARVTFSILPPPARLRRFREAESHLASMIDVLNPRAMFVEAGLLDQVRPGRVPAYVLEAFVRGADARRSLVPAETCDPSDLVLVQFTSGSTGAPLAVPVTDAALTHNIASSSDAIHLDPDTDVIVSWLPLHHDMGLVGQLLMAMEMRVPLALADSNAFAVAPRRWMGWIEAFGGTISWAPSSAYAAATRTAGAGAPGGLTQWRLAGVGADWIDARALAEFEASAQAAGFDGLAFTPAYGLAEATLGVTCAAVGEGVEVAYPDDGDLSISPGAFGRDGFPLVGAPIARVSVRIRHQGRAQPDRAIGDIEVASPSVMTSYLHNHAATHERLDGQWLKTGDQGFLVDGRLAITGRTKDIIVVAGRNVAPFAVESAARIAISGRLSRIAAFGVRVDVSERIAIAIEARRPGTPAERRDVVAAVTELVGVAPKYVLYVPVGSLPHTTSGKVRRAECARLFAAGELNMLN